MKGEKMSHFLTNISVKILYSTFNLLNIINYVFSKKALFIVNDLWRSRVTAVKVQEYCNRQMPGDLCTAPRIISLSPYH